DVLLHLTQYGNEVMVVIGPKGSGKTALLHQFQKNKNENWKVGIVEIMEGSDERKFLKQLYRAMDLSFRGATYNELMDYIEKHFRQLQENSVVPVILVDNVDLLPITGLKKILEMASLTNEESKPLIRVIICGTEKIKEQLKQPQLGHLANLPMRSVDLPPLSEEQTVHYILHRTLAAKFNGKDIFNEAAILKIYRESFGWPARINEICHDILTRSVPGKKQDNLPEMSTKSSNPKQLVAAGIAVAVLAAVLVFQNQIGDWVNKGRKLISSNSEGSQQSQPVPENTKTLTKNKLVEDNKPATLVEKLKSRDSSYQEINSEKDTGKQELASSEAGKPTSLRPVITLSKTSTPDDTGLNISHGNDWILRQKPDRYTLQIVAGESLNTVDDFIKEHQLKDNIALYHSLRNSKDWYGLIYGIYETKPLAVAAADQMPAKLKTIDPWIRPLSSVQQDIHKLPVATVKKQESLKERLSKPLPKPQATMTSKTGSSETEVTRREEWIMRQRYSHYTLQLVANEKIEVINQFINRHKLKNSIALYKTVQNEKPWYVLIYGIYSNQQLAESGINLLPADLQLVKPSIRKFEDIQNDIRKVST
ncbi:MAG: SPOR domain-containing protein, partial [Gammaproteobacteria bacterium]|nr:SPOR domain-containing protein [Gammaproteobacteria bacterium]